jgi:hypothetical protein
LAEFSSKRNAGTTIRKRRNQKRKNGEDKTGGWGKPAPPERMECANDPASQKAGASEGHVANRNAYGSYARREGDGPKRSDAEQPEVSV